MRIYTRLLLLIFLFAAFGQRQAKAQRIYGTGQENGTAGLLCLACGVTNPGNAADGNSQTFSTLAVTVGIAAQTYQTVIFPAQVAAGVPVTLKIGSGDNLLDATVLGQTTVQAYNGATPVGAPINAGTLLTAANNNNQAEITFSPGAAYDRVRLTLNGGIAGVLSSLYLYEAYHPGPGTFACNTPIDELHGISSALLGLGLGIGGVANPANAIDGNLETVSTLNAGVGALGAYAQQTAIFGSASGPGDSVRITLSVPASLITAGVLPNISIRTYNGGTYNNDAQSLDAPILRVTLLTLNGGAQRLRVSFVPANSFDRVQVRLTGGIAAALTTLNIHEFERVVPPPVLGFNGGGISNIQICSGSTATITASAPGGAVVNWYSTPSGGTPVFTGSSFTTPALTASTTYYAESSRAGCTDGSLRTAVAINVIPLPATPVLSPAAITANPGSTPTVTVSNAETGVVYNWFTTVDGTTPVFTGTSYTLPALAGNSSLFVEAVNSNGCTSASRTSVVVTMNTPPDVAITPPLAAINAGSTATFTATSTLAGAVFNWYDSPSDGTLLFTGPTFTTPVLNANAVYYAEAADPATGAASARATATVNINPGPDIAVNPPSASVNPGQTASFTATSTNPGVTFNWYDSATSTSPIFSGPAFTSPPVTANTTYYVSALDPATNAVSPRIAVPVSLNPVPDVVVTPPSIAVNAGQTATFTASSGDTQAIFRWYDRPSGGSPVFTGTTFTTPALNSATTFYVEAVNPQTNATSPRTTASVTVNSAPDITVSPPAATINPGETATFTATSGNPNVAFRWYDAPTGGTPFFSGSTFTTPPLSSNTTYYVEAVNSESGATSPRATATVSINGAPDIVVTPASQNINPGQTATFSASSSTPGAVFNWYRVPAGGSAVFNGASFTSQPLNAGTTFYVEAIDPATNATSGRVPATVVINGRPDIQVSPPSANVSPGDEIQFTASSSVAGVIFNWYDHEDAGTPLASGPTFTPPTPDSDITYYAEATDPATGARSDRLPVQISVIDAPQVAVSPPAESIAPGQRVTFTGRSNIAAAEFFWYTQAEGGSPVYAGATFTSPPLNRNTNFYVEARDPSTGATSERIPASVNVVGTPDIRVTPLSATTPAGQRTEFRATSTTPNAIFNWYDANGDELTPVFTGPVFTTPALNSPSTFYAEAVNPATNAISPRIELSVNISNAPSLTISPNPATVNPGETATLTASSNDPDVTIRWYTDEDQTEPVASGSTFTTPAVNSSTEFYAEAVNNSSNASSGRIPVSVVVNGIPDIRVRPQVAAVNPGETVTFTASSSVPGPSFNWYDAPGSEDPLATGATFTIGPLNTNVTVYAEAVNPATGAASARTPATAAVRTAPLVSVSPEVRNVNERGTATFTASSNTDGAVFNWYTTPRGGDPVFSGATFTSPALSSNTSYYVSATDPASSATSDRTAVTVTVNPAPALTVSPPTQNLNAGQLATFTASSPNTNAIFRWYDSEASTTPVFTGASFTSAPISTPASFFVEAVDPVTGATSLRVRAEIQLNSGNAIVFVPNAFSPNGDGRNDVLATYGATLSDYDFRIYNQWGELMFQSVDPARGWDGTWRGVQQPVGVYVYYLRGITGAADRINRKGTITLIR